MRSIISRLQIRTKLTLLLLVFELLPLAGVMPVVFSKLHDMQQGTLDDMQTTATTLGETVDRNLFERYGDVQAFGVNAATRNTANWYNHDASNPLISAMNSYMTNYGLYKVMLLVDMDGKVAAVNSVDNKGKAIDTAKLHGVNFKDASWFQRAVRKDFTKSNSLNGTVVEQPRYEPAVADSYRGEDGFTITFAAPVYDASGTMIGVWANFADFGLVEDIVKDVYAQKKARGSATIAFAIADDQGKALVLFDPVINNVGIVRDKNVIGKKTLVDIGIPAAASALSSAKGTSIQSDKNSNGEDAIAWGKTDGALGFSGLGWSVIIYQPSEEAFGRIESAKNLLFAIIALALVVIGVIGFFIGARASRPLSKAAKGIKTIASGDYTVKIEDKERADEFGFVAKSLDELRMNLDANTRVKQALDSVTSNVMMADENHNIIYMNQSAVDFLKDAESDIQKDLPRFNVASLIGSNIDIFHKNPAPQRGMLAKLNSVYKTSIMVGGRSFNLVATPVYGQNKERIGTVVEWQDGAATGVVAAMSKSQALIEFDTSGKIVTANQNFLNVMGYSLDEIKGKHHSMFCSKEEAANPAYKQFWENLARGESQIGEYRRFNKGGKEVWISESYNPVLDLTGRPVRVVKTAIDISGEMEKRKETALLSLVANETDNSVIITSKDELIEYVNPGFTKMTGYSFDEVKGKKPGDILQGKLTDAKTKKEIRESIKAHKPLYTEILNYHKNGDSYWVSLAINPVFDKEGKIERFISIQSNVTATKEKALDLSMQIDAISKSQAVIDFNMDGTIISANKNFLDMMDYTMDEIRSKHHSMFVDPAYVNSADYRQFWENLNRAQARTAEFKRIAKGGREVYIQASYNPILDLTGKPCKVVKYAIDITAAATARIENERGMNEAVNVLQGVSEGNLTQIMEGEYLGAYKPIKEAINATVARLKGMVLQIKQSAQSMNEASSKISTGSGDLSQRTEQQASSLEETAASMEQITGTVKQNAENAKNANNLASGARGIAERGGSVVSETVSAMQLKF